MPLSEPDFDWQAAFSNAEASGDDRPTWAYDWPAGQRMSAELAQLTTIKNARVCDLGCGRGQLGFTALELDARLVYFCDHSAEILSYVGNKLHHNGFHERGVCSTHRWGSPIPGAPFDVILGGDILYRPECFADLLASIASSLSTSGLALLSDPRSELEPELFELSIPLGLISRYSRRESYSLIEIRCSI